jgi:hypothetical protein
MAEGAEKKEGAGLADIAKSDFILLGAFLIFLGLMSTDAYYRSFGLPFQYLSYPWNLILFRGVQTVRRIDECRRSFRSWRALYGSPY